MRNIPVRLLGSVLLITLAGCADSRLPHEPGHPLFAVGDCELGMTDADALDEIAALHAEVDALSAAGALNDGQASALHNHLTNAQRQLEAGRRCPAAAMLRALRRQVEAFAAAGILTDSEAAPLLDGVDHILGDNPFIASTVSAGGRHTCALTPDGTAYCWGSNEFGALGDGTSQDRLRPVAVATSLRFQSIATGRDFTCAVSVAGQAYCWGVNHRGQLGDGTTSDSWTPVAVQTATLFESIVAGTAHTCALDAARAAHCWGGGNAGQLGRGVNLVENPIPAPVLGGHQWQAIVLATSYTCGLLDSGEALCWGSNGNGGTGQGMFDFNTDLPSPVVTDLLFSHIAARDFHTCALSDGAAWCWGGNFRGELGDGVTGRSNVPVAVATSLSFASIVTGASTSCALTAAGEAWCWGWNDNGRLGDGTTENRPTPTLVAGGLLFSQLFGGGAHNCGMAEPDGGVFCWGRNDTGQVGDGSGITRLSPTAVSQPAPLP